MKKLRALSVMFGLIGAIPATGWGFLLSGGDGSSTTSFKAGPFVPADKESRSRKEAAHYFAVLTSTDPHPKPQAKEDREWIWDKKVKGVVAEYQKPPFGYSGPIHPSEDKFHSIAELLCKQGSITYLETAEVVWMEGDFERTGPAWYQGEYKLVEGSRLRCWKDDSLHWQEFKKVNAVDEWKYDPLSDKVVGYREDGQMLWDKEHLHDKVKKDYLEASPTWSPNSGQGIILAPGSLKYYP